MFGLCIVASRVDVSLQECPASSNTTVAAIIGVLLMIVLVGFFAFKLRAILPVTLIKLGLSMCQIVASTVVTYDIPWPSAFAGLLNGLRCVALRACGVPVPKYTQLCHLPSVVITAIHLLRFLRICFRLCLCPPWCRKSVCPTVCRLFLIDVISLTRTNCTQPLNHYSSMTVVLVGFKLAVLAVVLAPLLWKRSTRIRTAVGTLLQRVSPPPRAASRALSASPPPPDTAVARWQKIRSRMAFASAQRRLLALPKARHSPQAAAPECAVNTPQGGASTLLSASATPSPQTPRGSQPGSGAGGEAKGSGDTLLGGSERSPDRNHKPPLASPLRMAVLTSTGKRSALPQLTGDSASGGGANGNSFVVRGTAESLVGAPPGFFKDAPAAPLVLPRLTVKPHVGHDGSSHGSGVGVSNIGGHSEAVPGQSVLSTPVHDGVRRMPPKMLTTPRGRPAMMPGVPLLEAGTTSVLSSAALTASPPVTVPALVDAKPPTTPPPAGSANDALPNRWTRQEETTAPNGVLVDEVGDPVPPKGVSAVGLSQSDSPYLLTELALSQVHTLLALSTRARLFACLPLVCNLPTTPARTQLRLWFLLL